MGNKTSTSVKLPDMNKQIPTDVTFFYPIYGLEPHVDAFRHICSSEYSSSPLESVIITPFVRPLFNKISNLKLVEKYGQETFWSYLHPSQSSPTQNSSHIDTNYKVRLQRVNKRSDIAQQYFSVRLQQIIPSLHLPLASTSNISAETINETTPMTFLKLYVHHRSRVKSSYKYHLPLDYIEMSDDGKITPEEKSNYENLFPIHGFHPKTPPLSITKTDLYPNTLNIQQKRTKLFLNNNNQLELPHICDLDTSNPNEIPHAEDYYYIPNPHLVRFMFPPCHSTSKTGLLHQIQDIPATFKPPIHMGTIIILDFNDKDSVNEFYHFLYQTQSYLSKGCILPLTDVQLYLFGINMATIDISLISVNEVKDLCGCIGFRSENINIISISGEDVHSATRVSSYTNRDAFKLTVEKIGLSLTQHEYNNFTTMVWEDVWVEYFKWIIELEQSDTIINTKKVIVNNDTIEDIVQLIKRVPRSNQWPVLPAIHTLCIPNPLLLQRIQLQSIYQLLSTSNFEHEMLKLIQLPFDDPTTIMIYSFIYHYILFLQHYIQLQSSKQEPKPLHYFQKLHYFQHVDNPIKPIMGLVGDTITLLETPLRKDIITKLPRPHFIQPTTTSNNSCIINTPSNQTNTDTNQPRQSLSSTSHIDQSHPAPPKPSIINTPQSSLPQGDYQQQSLSIQSIQYPGLPSHFDFDAFIYIDNNVLLCDPLAVCPIPIHTTTHIPIPSTIKFTTATCSNDPNEIQEQIRHQQLSKLPSLPTCIQSILPTHRELNDIECTLQYKQTAITKIQQIICDPILIRLFGITPPKRDYSTYHGPSVEPVVPNKVPINVRNLMYQSVFAQQYTFEQISSSLTLICYLHQYKPNLQLSNIIKPIQQPIPIAKSINNKQRRKLGKSTTTVDSTIPLYAITPQLQQQIQSEHLLSSTTSTSSVTSNISTISTESYKVDITYSTIMDDNINKYIPRRIIPEVPTFINSLSLLPLSYIFGIHITPFVYIRNHFPFYCGFGTPAIPSLHREFKHVMEWFEPNPKTIEYDMLKVLPQRITQVAQDIKKPVFPINCDDLNDFTLPIPSLRGIDYLIQNEKNKKVKDTPPIIPKYIINDATIDELYSTNSYRKLIHNDIIIPNLIRRIDMNSIWNILSLDCTIHRIILCCNPIDLTGQIKRSDLNEKRNSKYKTFLECLKTIDFSPEIMTYDEYQYLKYKIPIIYKEEFILLIAPFLSTTQLDKIQSQFIFHFVAEHELQELFEMIQLVGVNQRIELYRNHLPQ